MKHFPKDTIIFAYLFGSRTTGLLSGSSSGPSGRGGASWASCTFERRTSPSGPGGFGQRPERAPPREHPFPRYKIDYPIVPYWEN